MKVIGLKAENIKKLTLVNLDLDGDHLRVSGPPGRGKSTLVDLVWAAITKKDLGPRPVQAGKESGYIEVQIGDPARERTITVRREYDAEGGDKLKVRASDHSKVTVTDIQKLIHSISFDPLEFYQKKGIEQVNMLLRLLGVNLGDLDQRRKALYEERTTVGRVARAHRDALGERPAKVERASVAELSAQLNEALEFNRDVDQRHELLTKLKDERAANAKRVEELRIQLANEESHLRMLDTRITKGEEVCAGLQKKDTGVIMQSIKDVEQVNRAAEAYDRWMAEAEKAAACDTRYKDLDEKVKAIDQEKEKLLSSAKWPVPGLSVDGDIVTFNGSPLIQEGEGKKLEVSFAIAAAMAPELRICRIDGAESLGASGRAEILRIAKECDMQVFMSRVADGEAEEGEITIEEGVVRK